MAGEKVTVGFNVTFTVDIARFIAAQGCDPMHVGQEIRDYFEEIYIKHTLGEIGACRDGSTEVDVSFVSVGVVDNGLNPPREKV